MIETKRNSISNRLTSLAMVRNQAPKISKSLIKKLRHGKKVAKIMVALSLPRKKMKNLHLAKEEI